MPDIDLMKDRIRAAQIVLPCADINDTLLFASSVSVFEVLEIGCPAIHETHADHALNLPNDALASAAKRAKLIA